jgi:MYXO-CTERM domain-containing protein
MALQYSRSDYRTWDLAANKIALTGTIPAGGYYLVKLSANASGLADLPIPDATGTTVVASGGALFAITSDMTTLDCGPPPPVDGGVDPDAMSMATACSSSSIVDFVGYGNTSTASPKPAPVWEGSGAAPTAATTSVIRRKGAGCVETDDNAADFELVAVSSTSPPPRNSTSPVNLCVLGDAGVDSAIIDAVVADTAVADTAVATDSGVADTATASDSATTDAVAEAATDTGEADTGSVEEDTGTATQDTGPAVVDTGVADDAGVPTDEILEDDGCSCRVPGAGSESSNAASGLGIAALAGLVVAMRRRR